MTVKIEMLRTFVTVAECKNLADAADRLGRSASALSMMLKQFEEHLGTPLFETDRKNKLSAVGEFVLEQAQDQLHQFDHAVAAIESYAQAGLGTVRVASVPSVAGTILPHALKSYTSKHPNVQIELRDMDSANVLRALEKGRADIGIATVPEHTREFHRTALFTDRFAIVCRRDHPLAQTKSPLKWSALEGEVLIANDLCAMIQDPDFQTIYQRSKLTVHNTLSLLVMVKEGLGVSVLPLLANRLEFQDVVYRPIGKFQAQRKIDLLHLSRDKISPATTKLVDQILSTTRELMGDNVKSTARFGQPNSH